MMKRVATADMIINWLLLQPEDTEFEVLTDGGSLHIFTG